ncbi:hypothetical protein Pyn_31877 [Prunus yedoensis var. nudiflora]|uniref:Uncharacterized protein n=1 Tax=Prunus yedoensis var. nudiflora TaxID=2094558 RepID=A0A314ZPA7_PRUYE|nr:hypothetical protein Pyn_31877 [Prunus yedoensis var. nudiflora]
MSDWGPVFVAVILFVLLSPGLLFQLPGRHGCVEFGNFQTSGAAIMVHSLLYFALICVFLLAIKFGFGSLDMPISLLIGLAHLRIKQQPPMTVEVWSMYYC